MKDHRLIDERSRALGEAIAARLAGNPALIARARATLERWLADANPRVRPVLVEWQAQLERPLEDVIAVLTGRDERAARLRQSSPFAGMLATHERNEIFRRFARDESPST